jgi:hypothetical protein
MGKIKVCHKARTSSLNKRSKATISNGYGFLALWYSGEWLLMS